MKRRGKRFGSGNSIRASGMQVIGGIIASALIKEFKATDANENPYLRPGAIAALGHVAKKYNANLGAGLCGGGGVLLHQAYDREQEKQKQETKGVVDDMPRVNAPANGYRRHYGYTDGVYEPVN